MFPQLATRVAVNAVSKTNGATASGVIDTVLPDGSRADWCTIDIIAATADVVSDVPTVLKLQECDTTVASSFADVVGFRGGTATSTSVDFVINQTGNTAATAVLQNNFKFNVDCRGRKRYLQPVYSPQTTQVVTIIANLGRGRQSPVTAAKANAMNLVEG